MKITTREGPQTNLEIKKELAQQLRLDFEKLVDKLDDFLEMRIAAEFGELRADMLQLRAINQAMMAENLRFRSQIDVLSLKLLDVVANGNLVIHSPELNQMLANAALAKDDHKRLK